MGWAIAGVIAVLIVAVMWVQASVKERNERQPAPEPKQEEPGTVRVLPVIDLPLDKDH
jgi:hypothetical protein